MRIVLDLTPESVELARALAQTAGVHELWITIPDRPLAAADAMRAALADVLPAARVRAVALPEDLPQAWRDALRRNAWLALGADAVLSHPRASGDPWSDAQPLIIAPEVPASAGMTEVSPSHAPIPTHAGMWGAIEAAVAAHAKPAQRQRLAYISPLPPAHSGIADYSAELVPELAKYYDIDLIVDQPTVQDARLSPYPVRTVAWFDEHAEEFDRVLYHFGNSHAHQHMFALIRRHPGIVVLHDFFLSGVLDNLEREGYLPNAFMDGLYESHGYTALAAHRRDGRNPSIWAYPLNKGVLDHASGVIVHSPFSVQLAQDWYGPDAGRDWRVVPLLRGRGAGHDREQARARLGFGPDDFVVASFGMLGQTKMNEELLDAFLDSPLAADHHCRLAFVGANDPGMYGGGLTHKIKHSAAAQRIAITGFVTAEQYADFLAAADCAVQLRNATRGETSASVLDCLLYGVPTIVNAHGSTAALDPRLVLMLPDACTRAELGQALARLRSDAALRRELSERAVAHMQAEHAPAHVGALYRDAIEDFTRYSRHLHYRTLLADLAAARDSTRPPLARIAQLAEAAAFNQPAQAPRQLLVDVSAMVQSDLKTGIQRVVRSVVLELIANPPPGFRVEPVYSTGSNHRYQYARHYTLGMLGETGLALEDAPIEERPGDVFFGLDLFTNGTFQNRALLESMRARGMEIYFAVYDVLPVLRPDVFPYGTEEYFTEFLKTVTAVAHGVVCISRAVADELAAWTERNPPPRATPLSIGWFHLGADIDASAPSSGLPPNAAHVLAEVAARPTFLMVGTVEPRKGHAQALAAFEQLWQDGVDANLVIVGKQGWMVDKLCDKLATHPERDHRLFWLAGVSDEMLLKLYQAASALLSPSEGEGFGLPLIEAAQHGIPIIARELPVFREVAGEHAYYFNGTEARDLAAALGDWLALQREGKAPTSAGMPWQTWRGATAQVLEAIVGQKWYRTIRNEA